MLMILLMAWLILQRSAMTGPNMPITFNVMLLGVPCGFVGRLCVDTLGGDGNVWLVFWEIICCIHLLGNSCPSLLYRILFGPISVGHRTKAAGLPYWVRRYIFYTVLSLILPCLAGWLPFASLSDWKEHAVEFIKSIFTGSSIQALEIGCGRQHESRALRSLSGGTISTCKVDLFCEDEVWFTVIQNEHIWDIFQCSKNGSYFAWLLSSSGLNFSSYFLLIHLMKQVLIVVLFCQPISRARCFISPM